MEIKDKLFYFKLGLSSDIIKLDEFKKWLDKTFMDSDEEVLLKLEECKNINEIIASINEYYFKIKYNQNPDIVIKEILLRVKEKYNNKEWSLKQTVEHLHDIYSLIDSKYINNKPYLTMSFLTDDIETWLFDEDIIGYIEDVFKYCD